MLETVKMDARRNFNAELFDKFPAQRLLGGFATGKLATRKFPKLLHRACLRPVCDQQPAFRIDQ